MCSDEPEWLTDLRNMVREGGRLIERLEQMTPDDIEGIPETSTHEHNDLGVVGDSNFSYPVFRIRSLLDEIDRGRQKF